MKIEYRGTLLCRGELPNNFEMSILFKFKNKLANIFKTSYRDHQIISLLSFFLLISILTSSFFSRTFLIIAVKSSRYC